jgi:leucyl-tRNA synthetase
MKYKLVIKHAFNELLSVKETYLIAKGEAQLNPSILLRYIETILVLMNPITPHFCQYQWQTYVVPALKSCKNAMHTNDLLIHQGWPKCEQEDTKLS